MHRAGSRYLNPSRGGRLHAVTKRRKAFCWSGVKSCSACIHTILCEACIHFVHDWPVRELPNMTAGSHTAPHTLLLWVDASRIMDG